jgi:hypothetical protein
MTEWWNLPEVIKVYSFFFKSVCLDDRFFNQTGHANSLEAYKEACRKYIKGVKDDLAKLEELMKALEGVQA